MKSIDITDSAFRSAVAAIDAGDAASLRQCIAEHPRLLGERLEAGEGYFEHPYLLWFVAGNPVRSESLPANIPEIARTLIEAARKAGVESLPDQIDYTLGLVSSGRVPRESGVQLDLIDVLCDAGANPAGPLVAALAHHEIAAAERLLERGAQPTLLSAVCLNRPAEIDRLLEESTREQRQGALAGAALFGNADALAALIERGVDVDAYSPDGFHSHAAALHHAVDSGRLDAVRVLVDAGARLDIRDRVHGGTPVDWADYLGRPEIAFFLRAVDERAGTTVGEGASGRAAKIRSLVAMIHVADVQRSISFYEKLGLRVADTFAPNGGHGISWAWLEHDSAQLMLTKASKPVDATQQAVLFYVFFDDVPTAKATLEAGGIVSGPIEFPFYAPRGEFRITDPDGYAVMVTHAD